MQAQGLQRTGGDEQDRETAQGDGQVAVIEYAPGLYPAKQAHDHKYGQADPPPGGKAEQSEQKIGHPGAGQSALVDDDGALPAEKIAWIGRRARGKDQCHVNGDSEGSDPAGFAQQARQLGGGGRLRLRWRCGGVEHFRIAGLAAWWGSSALLASSG